MWYLLMSLQVSRGSALAISFGVYLLLKIFRENKTVRVIYLLFIFIAIQITFYIHYDKKVEELKTELVVLESALNNSTCPEPLDNSTN